MMRDGVMMWDRDIFNKVIVDLLGACRGERSQHLFLDFDKSRVKRVVGSPSNGVGVIFRIGINLQLRFS